MITKLKLFAALLLMLLMTTAHAEITIPAQLHIIEEEAFCGASGIDEIILPATITEIHSRAFAESSLSEIFLPESLTYIAEDAFSGCSPVRISALPGTYAWEWCIAHGMSDIKCTGIEQLDNDSITISWIAPDEAACDILVYKNNAWSPVATGQTCGTYTVDGLNVNLVW